MMNSFYCSSCEKYTNHVEITYREAAAIAGASILEQIIISLSVASLPTHIIIRLMGIHFWKCSECGKVTLRNSAGDVIKTVN